MADNKLFNDLISHSANRRSFVKKLGLASAVVGATAATRGSAQITFSDVDILNFALNLEYLEAEFYTIATTGQTLSQFGVNITGGGASGATTGGAQVSFGTSSAVQNIALEIAADERAHVALLQSAIAGIPGVAIGKPAINLNALGFGFGSVNDFLKLARIFEDIGVTAYAGAAPLIQSKAVLGYAARILAVEALHAGNIRLLVSQANIATAAVDGADHIPPPSGTEYFSTDSSGLVEVRTPQQVLFDAYGAASVSSGGFFPNGVNGLISMSSPTAATTDGASIVANPNPISVHGTTVGSTTISWNAPSAMIIQVRVGSPSGALLTDNFSSGSMTTGAWVTDGLVFYLQDVSNGKALTSANTLATTVVHVQQV